jgi:hypothetical protein
MVTTTGKLHNPFRFREISQNGTQLSAIYQDLPLNMRHLSTTKLAREDLQHTMKSRIKRASRARPSLFVAATTTKVLLAFYWLLSRTHGYLSPAKRGGARGPHAIRIYRRFKS